MGVSTAHEDVTAGTTGWIYVDDRGNEHPSSNNHVDADCNKGEEGDAILQPGPYDEGKLPDDKCGELAGYVKLEDGVKCDVAWIDASVEYENELRGDRSPQLPLSTMFLSGSEVVKSGRTTGVTRGVVKQVDVTVKVRYPDPVGTIMRSRSVITTKMLEGGDSGDACAYVEGDKIHPALTGYAGNNQVSVFDQVSIVEEVTGMSAKTEGEGPPGPPNTAKFTAVLEKKKKGKGRILGHAKLKETEEPVGEAKATIKGPVERTKKMDEEGDVAFKDVPAPAKYDWRVTKKGLKPDSGTITEDDWTGTPGE